MLANRELIDPEWAKQRLIALDQYEANQSLRNFVPIAWPVLEPVQEYKGGWAIDAMCEHLEAITYGWITRLLINVPPGSMKSLLSSVFWPAWEWGPRDMRYLRYLATSFNDGPIKRDTRKMRDLVLSEWYADRWPLVKMVREGETSFANSDTGSREGKPFGSLTSQRGDRLIIDDPHSAKTAESDAQRVETVRLFREGAINRLNDQKKSAIIVIMQRLHEGDMSGEILANDMGYCHLNLPMEYDPKPFSMSGKVLFDPAKPNEIGFKDPRTVEGELLNPERFDAEEVRKLKRDMGSFAYAGQYEQRPVPRDGGMFKRAWFDNKFLDEAPKGTIWCRHWDLAGTERKTSPYTAGVKIGKMPDGRYVVGHARRFQKEGNEVRKRITATAEEDTYETLISLPQDPGQAGKVQKSDMVLMLSGYRVVVQPETGDKEVRAEPFAVQCEAGNVYLVKGEWNNAYLDELCVFPGSKFKDQVDASSGAFGQLITTAPPVVTGSYGR